MGNVRLTLISQMWSKVVSLAKREEHKDLKETIKGLQRIEKLPSKAVVVWNPTQEFIMCAYKAFKMELQCTADLESTYSKHISYTIDKLYDLLDEQGKVNVLEEK